MNWPKAKYIAAFFFYSNYFLILMQVLINSCNTTALQDLDLSVDLSAASAAADE